MDVSVIIPTYKPQNYLVTCLDSLCNQSFPRERYEIVIVLNGCKEPYEGRIKNYIKQHDRLNVQFIQLDVGNVSNARNKGLDIAKGDFITFVDDDDYVSATYIEELFIKASRNIISLCYPLSFIDGTSNFEKYSITYNYLSVVCNGVQPFNNAKKFFSGPVYKLIHRDIIGERRFDKRFKNGEDSLFMFLISDRMINVDFTSKDAVYYRRIRNGSATRSIGFIKKVRAGVKYLLALHEIYWSSPSKYNLSFFLTRNLGAIHAMISNK